MRLKEITVDIVVFAVIEGSLRFLGIKRKYPPYKNEWALPGGFVLEDETLEAAAARELSEETGVANVYLEQLYTFSEPKRDPRRRIISVAYLALIDASRTTLAATTDAIDAKWLSVKNSRGLAFDHNKILRYAVQRLRYKLEYTTIGVELLPEEFTLRNLQELYETILDRSIDGPNFRKKILSLGVLAPTGRKQREGSYRPAALYRLTRKGELFPRSIISSG
ncbi:MAG: NUDIX hydrolase [Candidatus Woesearchaeota archaeon]